MKEVWRILKFNSNLWRYYVGVSVFTIIISIINQLHPIFTKLAIDELTSLVQGNSADVTFVSIMAAAIFISDFASTIFSNIGGHIGDMLMIKIKAQLSERYYKHLLDLPQKYFDRELSGKVINRMNRGIQQIGDFVQMMSNNFLQFIFSTIFALAIVAFYSWQVALMLGVLYPIFMWMTARTSNKWQKYQETINENIDIASGRFAESISQVKVVKSYLQESQELSFFSKHLNKAIKTTKPQSRYWHMQDVKRRSVLNVIFFAVFGYVFIETARGVYTIGEMVLLIQYAALIRIPIFSISFLIDRTQRAIADSRDYFMVMDESPEITDKPGSTQLLVDKGNITINDLDFGYEKDQKILNNINLTITGESKIALVGESGEGKSTIASLLLRLYEPLSGSIEIDGQDISNVTQESLRRNIGVVFQDPALFSGTIEENIAYGNPKSTKSQIINAAKAANAHEFIEKLPKKYKTQIGERGIRLSGGQKQRLAIARAILKDAPILILDEATSSLDSKSEHLVQVALKRLMDRRTTIIIAHRLSTISHVDVIVTLKDGRVDEVGAPSKLAKTNGIYAQLLKLQQGKTSELTMKKLKKYDISAE